MRTPQREIPAVHRFTSDPRIAAYDVLLGRERVRACVHKVLDAARTAAVAGEAFAGYDNLRDQVVVELVQAQACGLIRLLNGTGVLLHTNFGRAPLAAAALAAAAELGQGYSNLEYDLTAGERGSRYERVDDQLRQLTGAEQTLVVNNCAAAIMLVLDTFAHEREVVVSRGELIEIGGGFRLPDVLRKSGARLVEVGTTNKTYPSDYRAAVTPHTAMFLRTHPSNFRISGFTAEVGSRELAALARQAGVISVEDLGSGALVDLAPFGLPHEPTVADEVAAGLDLVAFSGDKLLAGPQCGIIAGRSDLVTALKRNPLLRALRVDKLTLAALGATLGLYLQPDRLRDIPLYAMLYASPDALRARARALCDRLSSPSLRVCETQSATGGGTLPLTRIPSAGIAIDVDGTPALQVAQRLREQRPPLVGRIEDRALIIDLRSIAPEEDPLVLHALSCIS
ncbi:MAG: L-seryl-tRNA(Sec) selenium transferase [Candidatus Eremiobacteraeota bacterium]|nr:L-seryl-tRNA(Sec) selenium transferase [Candidatus Eremiobacteraeota bacterium]